MGAFIRTPISTATLWFVASTLVAGAAACACRAIAPLISHDPAELDGFLFVAGLYWICAAVGYFTARSNMATRSAAGVSKRTESGRSAGLASNRTLRQLAT